MEKWVYSFSASKTEGGRDDRNLLGGKGANLAEMCELGLPVPPGMTVSTAACIEFFEQGNKIWDGLKQQIRTGVKTVEDYTGKAFGDPENPLLFSVRSGARVSMPGMMDTVLNLGLNEESVQGIAKKTGNERFAWDTYRRFIQMFSNVVMGMNHAYLEEALEELKEVRGAKQDTDLTAQDLRDLASAYKSIVFEETGREFPTDPWDQLWAATEAVFQSWNNDRAKTYRRMNGFQDAWGTAVNIQSMVFGNMGEDCATGVCFTRDPSTGEKRFFGEYLINAQGEDVVAGIRTPAPLNEESRSDSSNELETMEAVMPKVYGELVETYKKLEAHYLDIQDIEFTVENNKLYILQTRNGKRTVQAGMKIAVDLVSEGLIDKKEAIRRIRPDDLNQLLHPRLDPNSKRELVGKGLPASPGAACGQVVFDSETAQAWADAGKKVILVRLETSPEDIGGMNAAVGILTARGGMTSHAAVVARGMGRPCVAGCSQVTFKTGSCSVGDREYKQGDFLTLDGGTGEIFNGMVDTLPADLSGEFDQFMSWADEIRSLKIRTNADNPEDSKVALNFGAEGIGLCRTEHMFFAPERVLAVREMIFADNKDDRVAALDKLLPFQQGDFLEIFKTMGSRPVNIRLLDPPLHEFLPHTEEEKAELSKAISVGMEGIEQRYQALHEFNPMLGHRGCRLGVSYPEIYDMQVKAIVQAALEAHQAGVEAQVEIMIPLVSTAGELSFLRKRSEEILAELDQGKVLKVKIGTMIELPRAALTADKVAQFADFFSFGTNDLTQTTFGLSRDDAGKFLGDYTRAGLYEDDPFVSLDQSGVGELVRIAQEKGKGANPGLHLGICGEHGGDPKSIQFCHELGLDYVSCSPFRIPVARLAAAQAALS